MNRQAAFAVLAIVLSSPQLLFAASGTVGRAIPGRTATGALVDIDFASTLVDLAPKLVAPDQFSLHVFELAGNSPRPTQVGAIQTILQIVKAPAPEVGRKIEGLSRDIWGFQGHSRAVRKLSDANLRYQVDRIYQGMIDGIERQLDHLLISFSEKSHGALYDAAAEQGVDHLLMPTVTGNQILSYPPGRIVLSDQARLYWLPKATSPAPVIAKPDAPKSDSRHKKKEQRRIEKILKARAGLGAGTESESRDSIPFRLVYSQLAKADLDALLSDHSQERHYNAVKRALGKMERDPREPVLHSHNPTSDRAHRHLWISHAENHTPGAYRIFWRYGRGQTIQILRITRHPNSSPREYIRAAEKADRIKISE